MLKITVQSSATETRFKLEGKVAGLWVSELEKAWHENAAICGTDHITIDISEVTFVDAKGWELLSQIYGEGATLKAFGCMMKGLIADIERLAKERPGGRKC